MKTTGQIIIFSDLDGTLLDEKYSFEAAVPALRKLKEAAIPLILCSSKTRGEIERYREKMGNSHPFISENGGGIFIPEGYFPDESPLKDYSPAREGGYRIIRRGTPYSQLRKALKTLREKGFRLTGFGDLSLKELSDRTGLPPEEAALCKKRDFDEPFFFRGDERKREALFSQVRAMGLFTTQGVYHHLLGDNDKGKAVKILSLLFRARYGHLTTIALGDSPNDLPMLENVDIPVTVQRSNGRRHPSLALPNLYEAAGIGPEGWNAAVSELITRLMKTS